MAGTNIGKAYVQIVPSAQGIKGSITNALGDEPASAGKTGGMKLATALKSVIVAAGIGKAISASITAGADLQQSLGGIETLFKDSAGRMKEYASQSFQTAGVSANKYMETVTSFSAAMISSLGGDTRKAADLSNQAMIDMSDNANKMGTDMESIMMTYQSLSRGNYAMLDNLKLGYSGTRSEMQRLLADAEKLTGKKFDISNFADVTEAIHAIQVEMGIAGTTALEAKTTFTGSFNSMKAAANDLLGAISLGMDVSVPMQNLIQTASTFFFGNFLPMLGNIVASVPQAVITAIQTAVPILGEQIGVMFTNMATFMTTQFPQMIQKGKEAIDNFVNGFVNNFPAFINSITQMITQGIAWFMQNLPQFISQGADLVTHLITGISKMLPTFITGIFNLIVQAIATFGQNMPQFLRQGYQILANVVTGLLNAVPQLIGSIPGILINAAQTFMSYDWLSIGTNIISGIVNGIVGAGGRIASSLMNVAKNAFDSVLSFLGIKSPSRLFRDKIGKMIPAGIAVGIEADNTLPKQIKAMAERTIADAQVNFSNMDVVTRTKFDLPTDFKNESNSNVTTNQTVNQTIIAPKVLKPSEAAQEAKNALWRLKFV